MVLEIPGVPVDSNAFTMGSIPGQESKIPPIDDATKT